MQVTASALQKQPVSPGIWAQHPLPVPLRVQYPALPRSASEYLHFQRTELLPQVSLLPEPLLQALLLPALLRALPLPEPLPQVLLFPALLPVLLLPVLPQVWLLPVLLPALPQVWLVPVLPVLPLPEPLPQVWSFRQVQQVWLRPGLLPVWLPEDVPVLPADPVWFPVLPFLSYCSVAGIPEQYFSSSVLLHCLLFLYFFHSYFLVLLS